MKSTMTGLALIAALALSACGADGEPESPDRSSASQPGLSISGTASFGVGGSF